MKAPAAWQTRSPPTKVVYVILFNFFVTTKTKRHTIQYSYTAVKQKVAVFMLPTYQGPIVSHHIQHAALDILGA
jgi:hypothetical protein